MSAEQEKIKDIAYRLWQDAGSPDGRDQEFWFAAESQVKPAKAKAPAKPKAAPKAKVAAAPKAAKPAEPKVAKTKAPSKAKAAAKV